ncbi:choice-of-anchor K domain-containing protein [Streptomyces parvus]|uniref:choice-of-anchor K domain-containing protein n=1 Tax=Streptomyces parvus TaxID=66428 RepID=UPI003710D5DA
MVQVKSSAIWQLVIVVPDNVQGYRTDRMTWGVPDSQGRFSAVVFAGTSAQVPLDGREFTLGTITVENYKGQGSFHPTNPAASGCDAGGRGRSDADVQAPSRVPRGQ